MPDELVLLSGATGLIGGRLLTALSKAGRPVRALTRNPERAAGELEGAEVVGWDGRSVPPAALAGAGAVVHLAGEPLFGGRLSGARRERVYASRIESTRSFADTLKALPAPERPHTLLCASAVGYYGSRGEELLDEQAGPGEGFLSELCRDWEASALAAGDAARVVVARMGVVLSSEGGALPLMALAFRMGLGGRIGGGEQWFPWIHIDDAVGLIQAVLADERVRGPVNAVAPEPVRNAELTRVLAEVLRRPARIPLPGFAVRAALGRELAGELLGSRRVVPRRALDAGFAYTHPGLESAVRAELG